MTLGREVFTVIGSLAGSFVLLRLVLYRWFLRLTDVSVGYAWKWEGNRFHPSLDVRNRSTSKTYLLANIAYTRAKENHPFALDNNSVWGKKLEPGSINFFDEVAPVPDVTSISRCMETQVAVRLQPGRTLWTKAQGPGQHRTGIQKIAFWLRDKIDCTVIPLE
jgi:hypothetical protein